MNSFNYNHLYYFYMISKLGGVTRASKALNTSQSSLSIQIKNLEEALDKKLFKKAGRQLEHTEDGKIVYGYCLQAFETLEDLSGYLNSSTKRTSERLNIGASDDLERPFVAELLGQFLSENSEKSFVPVRLVSEPHERLVSKLANREIDVLLTADPAHVGDLKVVEMIRMPVALVAHPKHLQSDWKKEPSATILKKTSVPMAVVSPGIKFRHETDAYLLRNQLKAAVGFESNVFASVTRAIIDGFAIGFVPVPYVHRELKIGQLVIVGETPKLWDHKIYIYSRNESSSSEIIRQMARIMTDVSDMMSASAKQDS